LPRAASFSRLYPKRPGPHLALLLDDYPAGPLPIEIYRDPTGALNGAPKRR
jgi:hypothetical protein